MRVKAKKKYWFITYHEICPVCGDSVDWREKKYGKKPKDEEKRHVYTSVYCHCLDWDV